MKERVLLEGVVSEVSFPNKGKLAPTDRRPSAEEAQPPAGILYIEPTKEYPSLHVKNALPGQKWLVSTARRGRYSHEGHLVKLLERAPYEIESNCPYTGSCGGCLFQTVPYHRQTAWKEDQVKKLLSGIEHIDEAQWDPIVESPLTQGYRNKMEFSFGDEVKDGPLTLGMHRRGSFHDVISTPDCQLVADDVKKTVEATLEYFTGQGTPKYNNMTHVGVLRHLVVRRSYLTKQILINLVTSSQAPEELIDGWRRAMLALKGVSFAGILHTVNDQVADAVRAEKLEILYGRAELTEQLLGLTFTIFPFSFFQTNTAGAEKLYEVVRSFAGDVTGKTVFDLYSGTGTIAQIMAAAGAKEVEGIEIVEEAVQAAKVNAAANQLDNCHFIAGDVLEQVETLKGRPDLIVLDPPREGIHPKAIGKIIEFAPREFIYVSCKPTSLVRDLPLLQEAGWHIDRIRCVDMFPQTPNVETVVLLSKGEVDSRKIRVEFSLEDMDMSEFQDGATYPQIKAYVLEHSGLKVSNLYISQIKRKCGIEVGKNYNLPKSEDSRQPQCPPEKEKAIREAFKYFGMI